MQDQVNALPAFQRRVPWNKGKLTGAKPPLMRVIFTRPTCQLSIALTPPRSRFDLTNVRGLRLRCPSGRRRRR
jgi:hypothetical protein